MFRRTTLAGILTLALVATACASGGTPQAEGPTAMALTPTTVAHSVASGDATDDVASEGIKVHGHWAVEVRDPDGTVAERVEFKNHLTTDGQELLLQLLAGRWDLNDTDPWAIRFRGVDSGGVGANLPPIFVDPWVFRPDLIFDGSMTATEDVTLMHVWTLYIADRVIGGQETGIFTETSIAPIDVRRNQSVYVEVRVSFS